MIKKEYLSSQPQTNISTPNHQKLVACIACCIPRISKRERVVRTSISDTQMLIPVGDQEMSQNNKRVHTI